MSYNLVRVRSKSGTSFDGNDRQEDEVIVYNGPCSYCDASEGVRHCHVLFESKEEEKKI